MAKHPPYRIEFAPEALDHLRAIDRKHYGLIARTVSEQLSHHPDQETLNRKPLEVPAPYASSWELRFGPGNCFRVFYEVVTRAHLVQVLAIGVKKGTQLYFSGKEFDV